MLHLLTRPQRLVTAEFYQTEPGRDPVREWLKTPIPAERQAIGKDVRTVEYGWQLGMPTCAPIGDGLWEKMILLHGFIKKFRVAPHADLTLARDHNTDLERRLRTSLLRQQT